MKSINKFFTNSNKKNIIINITKHTNKTNKSQNKQTKNNDFHPASNKLITL